MILRIVSMAAKEAIIPYNIRCRVSWNLKLHYDVRFFRSLGKILLFSMSKINLHHITI